MNSPEYPEDTLEEESLLHSPGENTGHLGRRNTKSSRRFLALEVKHWLALNLVWAVVNLAGLISLIILWETQHHATVQRIAPNLPPSPAVDAIEMELRGFSLTSQYKQPPSPKTDQAWLNLVNSRSVFPLSPDEFVQVNEHPESGLKFPDDSPSQGQYVGNLAANHQLHCLNALRKSLWFQYPYYKETNDTLFTDVVNNPPEDHMMHCLEMLRNAIMCFGDVSVITYNWNPGHPVPKANFRGVHSCQKWDRLEDWRSSHNFTAQLKGGDRPEGIV